MPEIREVYRAYPARRLIFRVLCLTSTRSDNMAVSTTFERVLGIAHCNRTEIKRNVGTSTTHSCSRRPEYMPCGYTDPCSGQVPSQQKESGT